MVYSAEVTRTNVSENFAVLLPVGSVDDKMSHSD